MNPFITLPTGSSGDSREEQVSTNEYVRDNTPGQRKEAQISGQNCGSSIYERIGRVDQFQKG